MATGVSKVCVEKILGSIYTSSMYGGLLDNPSNGGPSGVRVLDITAALSGPVATQILGDMGADVIKVEPPAHSASAAWGRPATTAWGQPCTHEPEQAQRGADRARKRPRSLQIGFVRTADVSVNTRPGTTRLAWTTRTARRIPACSSQHRRLRQCRKVDKPRLMTTSIQAAAGIAFAPMVPRARYAPTGRRSGHRYLRGERGVGRAVPQARPARAARGGAHDGNHRGSGAGRPWRGSHVRAAHRPPVYQRYCIHPPPAPDAGRHLSMMVLTDRQWRTFFDAVGHPEVMDRPAVPGDGATQSRTWRPCTPGSVTSKTRPRPSGWSA